MKFDLREKAKENIIVVAHRGACGGDIPCNTMASYNIALKQGADMLEVDVSKSSDGRLFLFHPGMEEPHLNKNIDLSKMPFKEIEKLKYVNFDDTETPFGIASFDDFLEEFKNRCYINIDKFWNNPKEIYEKIKSHNMESQVLVKSSVNKKVIDILKDICPELPFMAIAREKFPFHEALKESGINYLGVEVLFKKDSSYLASDEFIEKMHKDNILVWMNSIVYDCLDVIAGGHNDDISLTCSEDKGWGYIADKKADFIQTDWPMMVIDYFKKSGKYYKS